MVLLQWTVLSMKLGDARRDAYNCGSQPALMKLTYPMSQNLHPSLEQ